jgi:hypothetical protein
MMLHTVDTWTDKFGVTRCDVWVASDVRETKATALLPVIPDGEWVYAISHRNPQSFMVTHRYVFRPEVKP